MGHLSLAELLALADNGGKGENHAETLSHVESCDICRARLQSLAAFRASLKNIPRPTVAAELTPHCIPTELMGDYLGNRLPKEERDVYTEHVAGCEICFERALFHTESSLKMAEALLHMPPTPERFKLAVLPASKKKVDNEQAPSIWKVLAGWIASPVPAYAFAAAMFLFVIIGRGLPQKGLMLLESDATFSIYEQPEQAGPSFGFADGGRKLDESPADLKVSFTSGNQIMFNWKPAPDTKEYNFTLMEISTKGAKEIFETTIDTPQTTVKRAILSPGRAYRWRVMGETSASHMFIAVGQFVYAG